MSLEGRAIVSHDTIPNGGWRMEDVAVRPPGKGELLVEMVASGICHSDVLVGNIPKGMSPLAFYPRILGHEGAGYVKSIGPGVNIAQPGDPVLLSFASCEACHMCKSKTPALCDEFGSMNAHSVEPVFSFASENTDVPTIAGKFFGQSSFASLSVVLETSVVNVKDIIKSKDELKLFAPLGCGIQTGAGSTTNVANATPEDSVCVIGLGGVGLSALMAAKVRGCRQIIGIDRVQSRLDLAKELGATDTINTSDIPTGPALIEAVKKVASGSGPSVTIETSGFPPLVENGFDWTGPKGKFIQVGVFSDIGYEVKFSMAKNNLMVNKFWIGAIEGWANPRDYLPQMIEWFREGKFPLDKLVKYLPAENFDQALKEMHDGSTVKPVICWS